MAIYEQPVRVLLRKFLEATNMPLGKLFTRADIIDWFRENYPKIAMNTVTGRTTAATTNANSRVYWKPTAADDLFFQVDTTHLRRYDPSIDPPPLFTAASTDVGITEDDDTDSDHSDDGAAASAEFVYESHLRDYLAKNPNLIEAGLTLFATPDGGSGVEFPAGGRYVDLLFQNAGGEFVVVELKVSRAYDRVVGQLLRYMGWVQKSLAAGASVHGVIVASSISNDLRLACSQAKNVRLFEYQLAVTVTPVALK